MEDLIKFRDYLLLKGLSVGTVDKHCASLLNVFRNHGSFSASDVQAYILILLKHGRCHDHLNNIIAAARHYGRFVDNESAYRKIKYFPPSKAEERHKSLMSDQEIEAFLAITPDEMLKFFKDQNVKRAKTCEVNFDKGLFEMFSFWFKILAFSIMRPGEVAGLEVDMVNFGSGVFELPKTKTIPRRPPIDDILVPELQEYIKTLSTERLFLVKGKPVTRNHWKHQFKIRCEYLGMRRKKLSVHSFRHSGITRLLRSGVNLPLVQKIAGHKRIATTEVYTHLITEDTIAAKKQDPLGKVALSYDDRFKYVENSVRKLLANYAFSQQEKGRMLRDLLYLPS